MPVSTMRLLRVDISKHSIAKRVFANRGCLRHPALRTMPFTLSIPQGQPPMSAASASEIARFNSKWARVGDCHIWQGTQDRDGYGYLTFRRASRRAHRVALFIAGREIPHGHVVSHTCRNRACVNPQHLSVLSVRENALRDGMLGYVNTKKTHCRNGHPYDRVYSGQRYCSTCEAEKSKRLRAKWKAEGIIRI